MTSYTQEAAVFSQSHFSSKEFNSTEKSAKKIVNVEWESMLVVALLHFFFFNRRRWCVPQGLKMMARRSQHPRVKS